MPADKGPIEESAEQLFERAPCGYLASRPDGTIWRVNETFLTMTGLARERIVGLLRFQELLTLPGRIFYRHACSAVAADAGFRS